jgi:hypothetical protein
MTQTHPHPQSGNVFFIILIAIFMFAALSFAVSEGSKSVSVQSLTDDQAKLIAQEIISYGDTLSRTVQALKLRGCSDTQMGFENTVWKNLGGVLAHPVGHNPNSRSECQVFGSAGGKASTYTVPENKSFMPTNNSHPLPGHGIVFPIQIVNVGTANPELVLVLHYIDKNVCKAINRLLSISNNDIVPADDWSGSLPFVGSYASFGQIGEQDALLVGKRAGCIKWLGSGYGDNDLNYFQVLIAR